MFCSRVPHAGSAGTHIGCRTTSWRDLSRCTKRKPPSRLQSEVLKTRPCCAQHDSCQAHECNDAVWREGFAAMAPATLKRRIVYACRHCRCGFGGQEFSTLTTKKKLPAVMPRSEAICDCSVPVSRALPISSSARLCKHGMTIISSVSPIPLIYKIRMARLQQRKCVGTQAWLSRVSRPTRCGPCT